MSSPSSQKSPSICQPCLEDVLGADVGHQIWEFLEGVSDHPRLFCTSRKLQCCKQIPRIARLRFLEEELKTLNALVVPEESEAAAIQQSIIQKMIPYIQSGNYYLARRKQGPRIKTQGVYYSIKDAMRGTVKFCLDMGEPGGSFREGWYCLLPPIEIADGVQSYAVKKEFVEDPAGWEDYKCVGKFCPHKDNPEEVENIYRVDGEDPDQMYCGTCMDNNLYLQLQFSARHMSAYFTYWGLSEVPVQVRDEKEDGEDSGSSSDDDDDGLDLYCGDIADVEEPTAKRLIQINLWRWEGAFQATRGVWFVGTEATNNDDQLV